MSDLITKFNIELHERVLTIRDRLEALKDKAEAEVDRAEDIVEEYVDKLEDKIEEQTKVLTKLAEGIEDWSFERLEKKEKRKNEHLAKKLRARAHQADIHSRAALDIAIDAIERAEHAMLQASIAHADADRAS